MMQNQVIWLFFRLKKKESTYIYRTVSRVGEKFYWLTSVVRAYFWFCTGPKNLDTALVSVNVSTARHPSHRLPRPRRSPPMPSAGSRLGIPCRRELPSSAPSTLPSPPRRLCPSGSRCPWHWLGWVTLRLQLDLLPVSVGWCATYLCWMTHSSSPTPLSRRSRCRPLRLQLPRVLFVSNSLVSVYVKFILLDDALRLFDKIP
jgi:hypothetical protein